MRLSRIILFTLLTCIGGCLLFVVSGCVDELIGLKPPESEEVGQLHRKQYTRSPLPQEKLERLLRVSAYSDPPDRYGELVMRGRSEQKGMDPVVFSHRTHRVKYTCRVCHIELEYSMHRGDSGITREDHLEGRFCGACHDGKNVFSVKYSCELCHKSKQRVDSDLARLGYEGMVTSLPNHDHGDRIDWVEAIKAGLIQPKQSLDADQAPTSLPLPQYLKKALYWTTNVPGVNVIFPHEEHIAWLDCSDCHPDVFKIEEFGTEEFDKEKNLFGFYCGICHREVAFPMDSCPRCHPGMMSRDY